MIYTQIQTAAVQATNTYLQHLVQSRKCVQHYTLRKRPVVEGNVVYLETSRVSHPETVSIEVKDITLDRCDAEVISYDDEKHRLRVLCSDDAAQRLSDAAQEDVKLTTDLSFLIKNLQQWFSDNGNAVLRENTEYLAVGATRAVGVSQEQWEAVKCALQNRYAYIWGAPGTGKTERVLA